MALSSTPNTPKLCVKSCFYFARTNLFALRLHFFETRNFCPANDTKHAECRAVDNLHAKVFRRSGKILRCRAAIPHRKPHTLDCGFVIADCGFGQTSISLLPYCFYLLPLTSASFTGTFARDVKIQFFTNRKVL